MSIVCMSQDTQYIDSLNSNSFDLRSLKKDSSKILAYKALSLAQLIGYKNGIADAQLNLGMHYCNINILDSASHYLVSVYNTLQSSDKKYKYAVSAWYKAKLYQKLGSFTRAHQYLDEAQNLFKKQKNYKFLLYVINEQGYYYQWQANYPKALELYLEAYKIGIDNGMKHLLHHLYDNISDIYRKMGNTESALQYSYLSLKSAIEQKDHGSTLQNYGNIALLHNMLNNLDSASYYFSLSETEIEGYDNIYVMTGIKLNKADFYRTNRIFDKSNDELLKVINNPNNNAKQLLEIYQLLVLNYTALNLFDSAFIYSHKLKSLADKRGSKKHQAFVYQHLSEIYSSKYRFDSAFYYSNLHRITQDSILNIDKNKHLNDLRIQLETLENENEIQLLKFERYETNVRNIIVYTIITLLTLIAVAAYFNYKSIQKNLIQKKKDLEEQLNTSKKQLSNHTLSMIQRNNLLDDIKNETEAISQRSNGSADNGLKRINSIINLNKSFEKDWANFANLFNEIHNDFFQTVERDYPDLSDYEVKLCALIKLKLTNKEIATILNIEHKSVKMAKYRLKKKLNIEGSLSAFIYSIKH